MIKKQSLSEETVKNSTYKVANNFITKFGGLIFTIILARMLLPELYGLYNLVLSVVLIFSSMINNGTGKTIIRYVSEQLGKGRRKKARSYYRYLIKIRGILLGLFVLILAIFSKIIAEDIFNEPAIFLPLLAGCFMVLMNSFKGVSGPLFKSLRDFRQMTKNTIIFQSLRIILPVLAILILSEEMSLIGVFIALGLAGLISGFIFFIFLGKDRDLIFGKVQEIDKKRIKNYLFFITLTAISLKFFGQVDTLMLGRMVSAEHLGFYRAALNLVLAVSSLFGFGTVLLPVFTGITKERLERGFQKTVRYIIMFTIPAVVGLVVVARYFILAVYGQEYLPASIPLYALSLIVFIGPLIGVYSTVFQSKEKAKDLSKIVAYSLVLNILLNLILIKYFPIWFNKGSEFAILGAAVATVLSRCFYLLALFQISKKSFKIKTKFPDLEKFLLSSLVMAGFLVFFKNFVDINWVFGVIEILAGIAIYFITLYSLKGLKKEDIVLFKNVFYGKFKRIIETKRI